MDVDETLRELARELQSLGDALGEDVWRDGDRRFLSQIASNLVALGLRLQKSRDDAERQRLMEEVELLVNHVAVLAFSRANVAENRARDTILALLERAATALVNVALARLGALP